jgi:MtrB/PioB family decaheme-associated outer membrane protein
MKKNTMLRVLALSGAGLLTLNPAARAAEAGAEDAGMDMGMDFSLSEEPAPPPAPIYDNFVEAGIGYNSEDAFRAGRFNGLTDEGGVLNGGFRYLQRGQWDGDDLNYFEASGNNLGLDSRSLHGAGGIQGKLKLFLDFEQIPFRDYQGRTPYGRADNGALRLPPDWTSNPPEYFNSATQHLPDLQSGLREVDIETDRTRYGGGLRWNIDRRWSLRVGAEREEKEGQKPLGVAWGTSGQNPAAVIVPEEVDYRTDRFNTALDYRGGALQFHLAYEYSEFDNQTDSLWVDNPFTYNGWPPASYPNGRARLQSAPDNSAHSLNLSGGYNFSDTNRLTMNLAYSEYLQDDAFLPYTSNPLLSVQQGLPRTSLDGKIVNTLANLEYYSRPTQELDYKIRYRYTDRDNETPRDLYVYVAGDAEDQQIGGNQLRYRYNTPYDYREHLVGGDLNYRLQAATKLNLGYEYRDLERSYAERTENTEHTARVGLRHRFDERLDGSLKYDRTWRSGSTYDGSSTLHDAYTQAYIASLGNADFINHPELRMYNVADMTRDKVAGRLTFMPSDPLVLGAGLSWRRDDYTDTEVGLTESGGWSATLDATYAVNEDLSLSGSYVYDQYNADQAGWSFQGDGGQLAQSQDPARRWWTEQDDQVHTLGLGVNWKVNPKVDVSADYSYTRARTSIDTRAGSALAAGDFPDITSRIHGLRANAGYQFNDETRIGLTYIYERYKTDDWQTEGVAPDTIGRVLSLEDTDPDYDNHLVLVWTRLEF